MDLLQVHFITIEIGVVWGCSVRVNNHTLSGALILTPRGSVGRLRLEVFQLSTEFDSLE